MTCFKPIVRQEGNCAVRLTTLLATILATVLVCPLGCRRSSPSVKAPNVAKVTAKESADLSADKSSEKPSSSQQQVANPANIATTPEQGPQLYARHCAACHGERGDGKGLAAAFLFPKPRDFRAGRFRLVSTNNHVPTREDLQAVLLRGMPGSAMPSWAHLTQKERDALVDEVMRIRREGAREAYIQKLKADEGLTDKELAADDVQKETQDYVKEMTTPGQGTQVPDIKPATADAIKRGREIYAKFACIQCHGETGRGDGQQEMFDEEKMPTRPRDFTLGIFKGNPDPASLYRRVAYGMPGTPMPASSTMTPEQMVDLVHYIRSLSTDEQRQAAVAKREKIIAKRVAAIPSSAQDEAWGQAKPLHLHLTPLWWRTDADPDFRVQAVHDGNTIALRLTWTDKTANNESLHSESFKDAVAMELYRGAAEPFLGMGSPTSPVDVWFWDADRQNGPTAVDRSHPNEVVDVYPFSETAVAGPDLSRPAARMASQPDISLPARASGNQIVPPGNGSGGSSLHVGGPRTVTFRIPKSQIAQAHGTWNDGRWTVIMTRPLLTRSAADGVALEPGARASAAFAVWDGSHRDRDGQKSITIWQDLEIEK
jgi:DMSO reductase family type II enzyme heme b subunit